MYVYNLKTDYPGASPFYCRITTLEKRISVFFFLS